MDNLTKIQIPPFALPQKGNYYFYHDTRESEGEQGIYSGLSSTYFLFRQRPDMIAATISPMIQRETDEATEPSAKRLKQE